MDELITYLQDDIRIRYQNKGVKLLRSCEPTNDDLRDLISDCVYYVQFLFHKITPEYATGMCALTTALMGCGEEVRRRIGIEDDGTPTFQETISLLGAVMIRAFWVNGYILVERCGESNRSPYEIQALEKWLSLGEAMQQRVERDYTYLTHTKPKDIMTHKHPHNRRRVVKRSNPSQFDNLLGSEHLAALDILQQTGWEVNRDALEAINQFEWDDSTPDIPKKGSKRTVDILYRRLSKDPSVQDAYNVASAEWEIKRRALKDRSNIMERMMAVTKATALSTRGTFYNIMELDYRGRMYYAEPYYHYQGNDIMKGLLQFADAKPVDERGLYWLKLQAAATYNRSYSREELKGITWLEYDYTTLLESQDLEDISLDKMSLNDRINWVDHNNSLIVETALKKLLNQKAEYPVLFYATCLELYRTFTAQKDGMVHMSKLPVAIDGSQNVLQHSSAINRDRDTGEKVGLVATDVPRDIYVSVGRRIVEELPDFFNSRNMSMKDVRKNISKRSTMVRNYSAGQKSISSNMYRDCVKSGAAEKYDITPSDCFMLAGVAMKAIDKEVPSNSVFRKYLQKLVEHEIGKHAFTYANGGDASRDWELLFASYNTMNSKARRQFDRIKRTCISGLDKNEITWTTPTGFPVHQRLCYSATMRVRPYLIGKQITLQIKYDSTIPKLARHKSAIAANYIHSQDASHAARVINSFEGHSFALVHDSYATHPCDIDELLHIAKEEFKRIYDVEGNYYTLITEGILSDIEGFTRPIPELGDLDFKDLDDSNYFFS